MKKAIFLLSLIFVIGSVCFAVDPAEGFWLSIDDKTEKVTAGWEIYQEGGKLYGKILSVADYPPGVTADRCKESYQGFPAAGKVNQMPVAGTSWIFGLSAERQAGRWSGGNVIDPNDGKMYKCRIIFHAAGTGKFTADTLEMRGEIGLGIGRSQFWRKTDRQTASSLGPR
jgi:uncharacterized protein (DUF2147 family)